MIFLRFRDICQYLLSYGVDIDCEDSTGKTCLHHVIEKRNVKLLKFFLDEAADIEITDALKNTPLMTAVTCNNADAVKVLLDNGATMTKQNYKGQTCFDLAIEYGLEEVATAIVKHNRYNFDLSPFFSDFER